MKIAAYVVLGVLGLIVVALVLALGLLMTGSWLKTFATLAFAIVFTLAVKWAAEKVIK